MILLLYYLIYTLLLWVYMVILLWSVMNIEINQMILLYGLIAVLLPVYSSLIINNSEEEETNRMFVPDEII